MDRWIDGWMDWMDGWIDGWMDWIDGLMDWMASYSKRDASMVFNHT
jgi:hypothetical protein